MKTIKSFFSNFSNIVLTLLAVFAVTVALAGGRQFFTILGTDTGGFFRFNSKGIFNDTTGFKDTATFESYTYLNGPVTFANQATAIKNNDSLNQQGNHLFAGTGSFTGANTFSGSNTYSGLLNTFSATDTLAVIHLKMAARAPIAGDTSAGMIYIRLSDTSLVYVVGTTVHRVAYAGR